MLQISSLEKGYGSNILFENLDLSLEKGDRVGLIGRNGHGKTTLFKLINGEEEPDDGVIKIPNGYNIGYLKQHLDFKSKTVVDEACSLLYNEDFIDESYKAKAILLGLGFLEEQFEVDPKSLSGGYQIKLNLAKLLVSNPDLLLLDEPTNYLDIISIRWLIKFLSSWENELILITHDRHFMDSVTTHTAGIHRKKLKKIIGDTSKFYRLVAEEEEIVNKTADNQQKKRAQTEEFINRFRAKASKAKSVQSRVKALEREGVIEKLDNIKGVNINFPYANFQGEFPLHIKDLSFSYDKVEWLIKDLSLSVKKDDKIAIIGKNGKGKTTLLNLLAGEIESDLINEEIINFSDKTNLAFFGQTNVDRLDKSKTIEEELILEFPMHSRTKIRSICGSMLFTGKLAEKKISVLSGGERARVLFCKVLLRESNMLLLDEPTNHLDFETVSSLTSGIKNYPGAVVFVTHDENLLKKVATKLIVFDRGKVTIYDDSYEEFLKNVGWEDESDNLVNKTNNKKAKRVLSKEMKVKLKPIRKEINKTERLISKTEKQVSDNTLKIEELSKDSYNDECVRLSEEIKEKQILIDKLFDELEILTKKMDDFIDKES